MNLFLYLISFLILLISFLKLKKSNENLSFIQWLSIGILGIMLWNAFLAGIYGLVGIPICVISISIPSIILGIILFLKSKDNTQKYVFPKSDKVFLISLLFLVIFFWGGYFHFRLPIRYTSVDASVHCRWAKQIAFDHKLASNLFFGYVNDGLLMESLLPITGKAGFYHSFTLARIFDLGLSGLAFYSVVSSIGKNRYQKGLNILFSFIYLLGYPLYTIIFGFVYFGDAITIITGLVLVLNFYQKQAFNHRISLILCDLFLYGVFTSYTLFVPNVFLSVFIYFVFILWKKNKKLFSKENIMELLKIFLIPCLLGMAYAYVNLREISSNGGGISNEGGKYFDLFSNFIFLIPFTISFLWKGIKNRKVSFEIILFLITTIYTLLLFIGCWTGKVSTYYLSKIYNIIWLVMFIFLIHELHELSLHNKAIINGGIATLFVLGSFVFIDADTKLNEMGYIRSGSSNFLNIYSFNKDFIFNQWIFDDKKIEAYEEVNNLVSDEETLFIGEEVRANWYKTFTGQEDIETSENIDSIQKRIREGKYKYLIIDSTQWEGNKDYFYSLGTVSEELGNDIVIVECNS